MTSKLRDFNLLKVADVSSNSTTTNSVSVVVNADSNSANANTSNNDNNPVNFTQAGIQTPISPMFPAAVINPDEVAYSSTSNQTAQQIQELTSRLNIAENELKFYKLLSSTLSNILKDNNPKLIVNLIDQSGKIIIEAQTLIELIAIKTNTDANAVNIQYRDEEPTCIIKISPIKNITNIKINDETFSLKYNQAYNILQDNFNISLNKVIIPIPVSYR